MAKKETIIVKGTEIVLISKEKDDYISLTDMAKHKDSMEPSLVISHWMSTRYTVDFMGIWETTILILNPLNSVGLKWKAVVTVLFLHLNVEQKQPMLLGYSQNQGVMVEALSLTET